jgi:hypothetical protein
MATEVIYYEDGFILHDHFDVLDATEDAYIGAAVTEILEEIGENYIESRIVE